MSTILEKIQLSKGVNNQNFTFKIEGKDLNELNEIILISNFDESNKGNNQKYVTVEILDEKSKLLEPFRFSRFELGNLHPISNSPFPWS